ncbi:MAG: hypothetical protein JHC34_04310 [Acidobacteria bacterium]|nr:hypothetical protein [Acidobacteriota bacterium]
MLTSLSSAARVWGVVTVSPRKEQAVAALLVQQGLDAYCPMFKGRRAGARTVPLFPGYLFARLSPRLELAPLCRIPGVRRPLMFNGHLACIEPEMIERWKRREGGRGYLAPDSPPPFARGQKVRFEKGIFTGMEGTVLDVLPSKERVRLLLEYLGGTMKVEADGDQLK